MTEFVFVLLLSWVTPFVVAILILLINRRPMPQRLALAAVGGLACYAVLSNGGMGWIWQFVHSEHTSEQVGSPDYRPPTRPPD